MKTLYFNAKVYLGEGRFAEAVLVNGSDIEAIGTAGELSSEDAERVDCGGRTIIPGFNDSHCHLLSVGEMVNRPRIGNIKSIDAMVEVCRQFIEDHPNVRSEGLHGFGWNQDLFTEGEKRIPTRHDLDRISTEFPVVLERTCGHILSCNTKAIEMLGLDESSPDLADGSFWREESGYPSGVFAENGCYLPIGLIPRQTKDQMKENFMAAMRYATSLGVTSVQSNDLSVNKDPDGIISKVIDDIYENEETTLRYRYQICCTTPEEIRESAATGMFSKYGQLLYGRQLTVGPLKLFKDGSLGARTALMRKEYADDPGNSGMDCMAPEVMDRLVSAADELGIQVVTHVIGDGAVEGTVESYEKVIKDGPNRNRHALIHCQITDMPLLERIRESDIHIFYQPIFLNYDLHVVASRVGDELASTSYAFGTAIRNGSHVSFGTDSPVEDINPFDGVFSAVTRKDLHCFPEGGFCPGECISVEQAVDAYTIGSAEAEFAEGWKGRIAPGYVADMVILDRDIFTVPHDEIKDIRPVCTIFNGIIVYGSI
ncbi:MAG: amidohydrolase [Firmicutes bacterium]|nr:amidohydrolase [Bacillota bacterium]MBR0482323.1 amidohydrolase [Bacillota bacterium]